jgi:hypothetical protein
MGEALAAANRANDAAWRERDKMETRLSDQLPDRPFLIFTHQHCTSRQMVLSCCRPLDPTGPARKEGERAWILHCGDMAAYEARRRELGLAPLDAAVEQTRQARRAALRSIARAPAEGMAGIAVKLRAIRHDFRDGKAEFSDQILRSAARDAERLAKRGRR